MAAEDAKAEAPGPADDSSAASADPGEGKDDDEGDEEDGADEMVTDETGIKNTRFAHPPDGLAAPTELEVLALEIFPNGGVRSCFGDTDWQSKMEGPETFSGRVTCHGAGAGEPAWTLYSP